MKYAQNNVLKGRCFENLAAQNLFLSDWGRTAHSRHHPATGAQSISGNRANRIVAAARQLRRQPIALHVRGEPGKFTTDPQDMHSPYRRMVQDSRDRHSPCEWRELIEELKNLLKKSRPRESNSKFKGAADGQAHGVAKPWPKTTSKKEIDVRCCICVEERKRLKGALPNEQTLRTKTWWKGSAMKLDTNGRIKTPIGNGLDEKFRWWWREGFEAKKSIALRGIDGLCAWHYEGVRRIYRQDHPQEDINICMPPCPDLNFVEVYFLKQFIWECPCLKADEVPPNEPMPGMPPSDHHLASSNGMLWNLYATDNSLVRKFLDFIHKARLAQGILRPPSGPMGNNRGLSWQWLELMDLSYYGLGPLNPSQRSSLSRANLRFTEASRIFFPMLQQYREKPPFHVYAWLRTGKKQLWASLIL